MTATCAGTCVSARPTPPMPKTEKARAIAVFAHNEARKIIACLESVKENISAEDECFVLNNGSKDNTKELVADFAKENPFCKLVDIAIGDKANAWNVFVHELDIKANLFCFVDGDCEVLPGSLDALQRCIDRHPAANVAAAIPARSASPRIRREMLRNGGLAGNFYALPGRFVTRIRESGFRLPTGLIGDDSLVGALAYWDLDPRGTWDTRRLAVCEEAEYTYTRLSYFSLHDIRLYYRRKTRYSLRHFQTEMMKSPLKQLGLAGIPRNVTDLYRAAAPEVRLAWRGIDTWFDWLALKQIKACAARGRTEAE